MEYVGTKQGRKRRRKRRSFNGKQRRKQHIFEVKSETQEVASERNINIKKGIFLAMEASAFWENYKAGYEWQKRHDITWWKTRCFALEHENHVLKETIRDLVQNPSCKYNSMRTEQKEQQHEVENTQSESEDDNNIDEDIEFHLDQDMMNFLAQSIRHKIELKNKKKSEEAANKSEENQEETITNKLAWIHGRKKDAKLLYGEASSRILAMETALQATMERHIDKAKPQYWPNIPLRL